MKASILFPFVLLILLSVFSCKEETEILPKPQPETESILLPLAIYRSSCFLEGEVLIVYDPNTQDFQTYRAENYTVTWTKEGEVTDSGYSTGCVCGGNYVVKVIDALTGNSGQMEYTAVDCDDE